MKSDKKCANISRAYLFSEFVNDREFKKGDTVQIQIMRTGKWDHPLYGEFAVTTETLNNVISNFNNKKRGVKLVVDENHEDDHKALGIFQSLYQQGQDALFAIIELTKRGADLLTEGAYMYFSPEIIFEGEDEETGEPIKDLLVGGAFTNRPFFKNMQPLMANEEGGNGKSPMSIIYFSKNKTMNNFVALLSELTNKDKVTSAEFSELTKLFEELSDSDKTEEAKSAVDAVEEKTKEDEAAEEKKEENEDKEGEREGEGEEEKKEEEPAAADEEEKGEEEKGEVKVEASEKGMISVSSKVFHEMQAKLKEEQSKNAKMLNEMRFSETMTNLKKFSASEENKLGFALPEKRLDKIAKFCVSLSKEKAAEFFSILKDLKTVQFGELGSDGEPAKKSKDQMIADAKAVAEKKAKETGKPFSEVLGQEMGKLSELPEFQD